MATEDYPQQGINDSTYVKVIHAPVARRRTYLDVEKGEIRQFYVQLEYNRSLSHKTTEWVDIARFDHQPGIEHGHDIRHEGIHMDLCHPNGKDRKVEDFPRVKLNKAPDYCERYFDENYSSICLQYAEWEGKKTSALLSLLNYF